jgi:hypothetical protein
MIEIKIVPNAEPNAEGEWIETTIARMPGGPSRWTDLEQLVRPFVPEGFHVVAVDTRTEPSPPVQPERTIEEIMALRVFPEEKPEKKKAKA